MTHTKEQLYEIYRGLPEEIQDVMASMDSTYAIRTIGQKHQLHIDQIGELADAVGLVMLGLEKTDKLLSNIQTRLKIDQTTANAIAREVNEQIFLPIRESLQKLHENKAPDGVETIQTPAPTPPQSAGELPDKDKLLDEIEHPAKTPQDTVFEKKLGQLFRIPREEVDLDPYQEKPE